MVDACLLGVDLLGEVGRDIIDAGEGRWYFDAAALGIAGLRVMLSPLEQRGSIGLLGTLYECTHLTADAAAAWCFDNIWVGTEGIGPDAPVRVQLEIRAEEPRASDSVLGESGISLTVLVDILSRPARKEEQKWTLERGPLRLRELRAGKPN